MAGQHHPDQAVGDQPEATTHDGAEPSAHLLAAALVGAQNARFLQEDPQD